MKNQQEIEQKAEQTLNSLNNMQQLEANEYLHSKILQRMNDNRKVIPMAYNRVMLRLAAVLILFIGINAVSFYVLKQSGNTVTVKKAATADAFADAYNLNNNVDSY
jgi:hypothetical protein